LQLQKEASSDKTTEMKIITITETEVINTTESLKTKNSSGYDRISNTISKSCASEISKPFTLVCNSSLASRIIHDRFKYA
jgi:hypothetical protein